MTASTTVTVRAASTTNVNVASAPTLLDGISIIPGDWVLLKDQSNPAENGIWQNTTTAFGRVSGFGGLPGLSVSVIGGAINANTQWLCVTDNNNFTVGTTPVTFGLVPIGPDLLPVRGADSIRGSDMRPPIQAAIDSLIRYNYAIDYSQTRAVTANFTVLITDASVLIQVRPSSGTVTITLPNTGFPKGFVTVIALMSAGQLAVNPVSPATVNNLLHTTVASRFQAVKVTVTATSPTVWQLDDISVTGGGTCYLPSGLYPIDGVGLKLHPSVNLVGDSVGSTVLIAAPTMTGAPDNPGAEAALLTVCARAPNLSASSTDMYQPTIRDLQFRSAPRTGVTINGCAIEPGSFDPFFTTSTDYSGSSATFLRCAISNFSGYGVFSQADRQRFYCEYLRCVANDAGGIRILGNDPVIGPRSGFGVNGGTQVQVAGCSGLIMNGVNVFASKTRSSTSTPINIGMMLTNLNGATISGCVFNDTISIDGGSLTNKDTSISVSGCDFNPNDYVFNAAGNPIGTPVNDEYDSFIRISGMTNVLVSGNSFCAAGAGSSSPHTFAYLLTAVGGAQVAFIGDAKSDASATGPKNYRNKPVFTDTGMSSSVSYNLRDLFTGGSASGALGKTGSSRFPDTRGIDPSFFGDSQYAGYAIADSGPILQSYGPEFTPAAAAFVPAIVGGNTVITPAYRFAVIDVTTIAVGGTVTVQLPYTTNNKHLKIVFRGFANRAITIAWKGTDPASGLPIPLTQALRDVPVPTKTVLRTEVELIFQQSTNSWFFVTEQPVLFLVQCTPEGTAVPSSSQVVYTFTAPASFIITEIRGLLAKPRLAGEPALSLDVQVTSAATSLFPTTQPSFGDSTISTADAASVAGILSPSVPFLSNDDKIQILVNVSGSTSAKGLKVLFRGFSTGGV